MRTLRSALSDEPLARLMAIADAWDATITATSRADVAVALSVHMLQPDAVSGAIDALPDAAREALQAIARAGGRMPAATAERRFGVIRPMGPGRLERERPWISPTGPAEVLWYRGFVFRAFDRSAREPVEALFIPTDLAALLGPNEPAPAAVPASAILRPDDDKASSPLLDDVTTLLCHVQNSEVRVRADGSWNPAARRAVARMLRDADGVEDAHPDKRFALLVHLLNTLGWVRVQDDRLRIVAQPVTQWLQRPASERRAALALAWLNDSEWNDLAHVPGLALDMTHAWQNEPQRERAAIVRMFGEWCAQRGQSVAHDSYDGDIDAFVAYVREANPDFARIDGRYDAWHVRDEGTDEYLHGFENWRRVEGALIRSVLRGPLTWLEDGRMPAPPRMPADAAPFVVGADATITVAAARAFERFQAARVADWDETRPGAFVYRLTPHSLRRAQEQGIRPARVLEFLAQKNAAPLPVSVVRAVERWADGGADALLEAVVVLRTRDAASLDALLRLDVLRRAGAERLSPTVALLRPRELRAVRAAIAGTGLLVEE